MKRTLCIITALLAFLLIITSNAYADEDKYKKILDVLFASNDEEVYNHLEFVSNETGCIIYASYEWLTPNTARIIDYDTWEDFAETYSEEVQGLCGFFQQCGIESPNLLFVLLDGLKQDTELLVIYNGAVIYSYIPLK